MIALAATVMKDIRPNTPEDDCLRRLRAGDTSQLTVLMDRHGNALMNYLVAILRRPGPAEDAFQETWLRVLHRIHRFDPSLPFAPWLFRIGRNCAYDFLRRQRRWWPLGGRREADEPAAGEEPASSDDWPDRLMRADIVRTILRRLNPRDREIIWLRFFSDLSYEEIAVCCAIPMGTVKSRLRRALDRLAAIHAELEEADHERRS
jgi:RNA polymerase sigma-70 factor (ECF subfamily)